MSDNQRNEEKRQEPSHERKQEEKKELKHEATQGPEEASSPRGETLEEAPQETGMSKPKDFSPVPPPRVSDQRYSVVPPPAKVPETTTQDSLEDLAAESTETIVLDQTVTPRGEAEKAEKKALEQKEKEEGQAQKIDHEKPTPPLSTEKKASPPSGYYPGVQREPWSMAPQGEEPPRLRPPWELAPDTKEESPEASFSAFESHSFSDDTDEDYSEKKARSKTPTPSPIPPREEENYSIKDEKNQQGHQPPLSLEELAAFRQWQKEQEISKKAPAEDSLRRPSRTAPPTPDAEEDLPEYPAYWQPQFPEEEPYRWDYDSYQRKLGQPKKKKNSRGIAVFFSLLALVLVLGVVGLGAADYIAQQQVRPPAVESPPSQEDVPLKEYPSGDNGAELDLHVTQTPDRSQEKLPASGEILTVPQVAKKVIPSVVGVMKYSDNPYEPTGLGSGIIASISEQGDVYIVSNAHVVEQGSKFMIRTSDGSEFNATLVGEDVRSDLAVVRISVEELGDYRPVSAEFGTSENTQVGETAVAIGNPVNFDLSGSVTQGIVSAVNRKIRTDTSNMRYIQTDAAINPGNSGGALANAYGQVIGINTMKVNAIGFEGIGFAIPISDALPIVEELVAHGSVTSRAMLGITAYSVGETRDGTTVIPAGIMVHSVSHYAKFTPAIREYDIITHCNGERVYSSVDLHTITDEYTAGDTLELTVFRKSSTVSYETLTVTVELISSAEFSDQKLPESSEGAQDPTQP